MKQGWLIAVAAVVFCLAACDRAHDGGPASSTSSVSSEAQDLSAAPPSPTQPEKYLNQKDKYEAAITAYVTKTRQWPDNDYYIRIAGYDGRKIVFEVINIPAENKWKEDAAHGVYRMGNDGVSFFVIVDPDTAEVIGEARTE